MRILLKAHCKLEDELIHCPAAEDALPRGNCPDIAAQITGFSLVHHRAEVLVSCQPECLITRLLQASQANQAGTQLPAAKGLCILSQHGLRCSQQFGQQLLICKLQLAARPEGAC